MPYGPAAAPAGVVALPASRLAAGLLATVALAAIAWSCAGTPAAAFEEPAPLAYGLPTPASVVYDFSDSTRFAVESGAMGTMVVFTTSDGRADLAFREGADGLRVEVGFPVLEATFANRTQGVERADESHLHGPVRVHLRPDGELLAVDLPGTTPELAELVDLESLVRPLFVHLPAGVVAAGATWTDTVRTTAESGGTRSTGRSIITTTLAGDTVVGGRPLTLLRTSSRNEVEVTGVSGGVQVEQRLTGTTQGHVLWDPGRHLLVERREEGSLDGTLAMPELDAPPLPVRGRVRRTVTLREAEAASPRP